MWPSESLKRGSRPVTVLPLVRMKYPTGTKHLASSEVRAYARARAAEKPAAIAYCPAYFKLLPRARGLGKVFALFGGRAFRQEHVLLCAECACRRACFFPPQAAQALRVPLV